MNINYQIYFNPQVSQSTATYNMIVPPKTPRWMGLLRGAQISLGLILGLPLINLMLSAVWAGKLSNLDTRLKRTQPSTS